MLGECMKCTVIFSGAFQAKTEASVAAQCGRYLPSAAQAMCSLSASFAGIMLTPPQAQPTSCADDDCGKSADSCRDTMCRGFLQKPHSHFYAGIPVPPRDQPDSGDDARRSPASGDTEGGQSSSES